MTAEVSAAKSAARRDREAAARRDAVLAEARRCTTEETLGAAAKIVWKNEWCDGEGGDDAGPIYLAVGDDLVPLQRGGEATWWLHGYAESLARALMIPLESV